MQITKHTGSGTVQRTAPITDAEETPTQNEQSGLQKAAIAIACLSFFPVVYLIGKAVMNILG
ncbi:MAG: hypothetical protein ACE362_27055 [Phaeodactylibacter xiamenensis]|uniref:Uncharacterized protein n=1 Tax=Phaeodactylibacter xiamenensis TaxID=1524460 RepID=A0A098SBG3_9BACT|nr:hypothetical protein [Phaeodactylibacter xiamenensis]KGE89490.1 hypothetical protein IX84_02625 [Phaeodactylibacter xiamenensis]MCR9054926.1 hypothetical protein [bacterium]